MVIELRTNSLFDNFDYEIMSEIHLDLAGEFSPESEEFQQVAHELGIQLKYASPHDKRTNKHRCDRCEHDEQGVNELTQNAQKPLSPAASA